MVLVSPSPFRLKTYWLLLIACLGSTAISCSAEPLYFMVDATPYDRQMARICPILITPPPVAYHRLSLVRINQWMNTLHGIPYRYSRRWKTPAELRSATAADCKGKAVLLYEKMRTSGVRNLRFVIGKHHAADLLTHAWLEWDTTTGNYLLDPTFNSTAAKDLPHDWAYIPFYAYQNGFKYRAINATSIAYNNLPAAPVATSQSAQSYAQSRNGALPPARPAR